MNEKILKDILAEICEEEISDFSNMPAFKTSLRHRLAMKRIFTLFEKNSRSTVNTSPQISFSQHTHLSLRKRLIIIFVLIICAALLTGFIAVYISKNFYGTVYSDNTQLFAVNSENCPTTIEYKYYLSAIPNEFEIVEQDSSSFDAYTKYKNNSSEQVLTFSQYTKNGHKPHYNTEHHDLEEIEINGHSGLCIDFSDNEHNISIVLWDIGDYILELQGNLSKNELVNLAKSAKVLEN